MDASDATPVEPSRPTPVERSWIGRLLRNEWFGLFAFLAFLAIPIGCLIAAILLPALFPQAIVFRGAEAELEIRRSFAHRNAIWPESAHDFHYEEGGRVGSPHGGRRWSLRCGSAEACRAALEGLAGEGRNRIVPLPKAANSDDMTPQKHESESAWDLPSIRRGAVFEDAQGFYAADFDSFRLYGFER